MKLRTDLILASQSPRRKQLLRQLGLTFHVEPSPVEETIPEDGHPADIVRHLALEKAEPISRRYPSALTLAADTVVVHDGAVLGKPRDAAEARAMLRRLSGETHIVFTGLALLHPASSRRIAAHEATRVTFAALSDEEIHAYVASGAPMDKAGAYGIQGDLGAVFVARIEGDFYTVMGLPLHRLYRLLHDHFPDLIDANGW
jgi:septum formation protein